MAGDSRVRAADTKPDLAARAESKPVSHRTWWICLAIIGAGAFALRLLYLNQLAGLPFFDQPIGDSAVYLKRASEIASGALLPSRPLFYGSILYPYFLATVLECFHGNLYWVCFSQIIAGVLLLVLLAVLARRLYGPGAGLGAGILAALYGPFAFLEADILGVVWGLVAIVLGMLACEAWTRDLTLGAAWRGRWLGLAGAAFGLGAVERPNLVILVLLVAAWCASQAPRGRMRCSLTFLAGAGLPLALFVTLNVAGTGRWVPLTTSGGINLSIGYHQGSNGTYEEPWEKQAPQFAAQHTELEEASLAMASTQVGRTLTPQEASSYWTHQALSYIRHHPRASISVTLRKAALMLNNAEIPNHLDFLFIRNQAPALWLMPVEFGVVLALAVLGVGFLFATGRRKPETQLLLLVATGAMLSVVPFFVADRYRVPIVPPLIVLAGAGIAALLRLVRDPALWEDGHSLAALVGAFAAAAAITMLPLARPLMGHDYWMLAQAYQARGNLPAAVAAYEAAVHEQPRDGALLNNLAAAYLASVHREQAITTLRRAVAMDPDLALPHKNLGMMLVSTGEMNGALMELREAVRLEPNDAQSLGAIGALLAERGENAAAAEMFTRARRLAPGDQRLVSLLGHYPAVARRVTSADTTRSASRTQLAY